jgi:hypothetical protein
MLQNNLNLCSRAENIYFAFYAGGHNLFCLSLLKASIANNNFVFPKEKEKDINKRFVSFRLWPLASADQNWHEKTILG